MTLSLFAILQILWALCAVLVLPAVLRVFFSGIAYTAAFQIIGFAGSALFFSWMFRRQVRTFPDLNYRPQCTACRSIGDFLGWHRVNPMTHIRSVILCLNVLIVVAFFISPLVMKFFQTGDEQTTYQLIAGHRLFPTVALLFALVPAVSEELLFRGLFYQLTFIALFHYPSRGRGGDSLPITTNNSHILKVKLTVLFVFNALLFACLHENTCQSIIMIAIGLTICILRFLTGSIIPGIIYHFWNNMIALAIMQVDPYASPNTTMFIIPAILGIIGIVATIVSIGLESSSE